MALTDEQVITLASNMQTVAAGDADMQAAIDQRKTNWLVNYYNALADPSVYVFEETLNSNDVDAVLDWENEDEALKGIIASLHFLLRKDSLPVETPQSRYALAAVFTGAALGNTKTAILGLATIEATRAEALYIAAATGPAGGNGSAAGQAATAVFKGSVGKDDVRAALDIIHA